MPVGLLRFLVPEPERLTERAVQQAYLCGLDPIPAFCRARLAEGELIVEREGTESVKLNLPWRIDGYGEPLITTATLTQRDRPYLLPLELARGKLNQVRNQLAEWVALGLVPTPELNQRIAETTKLFTQAAVGQADFAVCAAAAQTALVSTCATADLLSQCYVDQALGARHRTVAKLPVAFGMTLGAQPPTPATTTHAPLVCNTAVVPMVWRDVITLDDEYNWNAYSAQIDWCRQRSINIAAGPLVRLDDRGFPDSLQLWQGDVDGVLAFTSEYVSNVVRKWRGQVTMWHVASYAHRGQALALKDDEKLRIIVRALETARRDDPETPLIVSFDEPWGEYLRKMPAGYSPLHVADHLVRSGLPLAALGLELEIGYGHEGTYHRDKLEFGRVIDVWASLGLPLYICLTVPGGDGRDARARSRVKQSDGSWPGGWTVEAQAKWVREFIPLLLSKPAVQGIMWVAPGDNEAHELPFGGLFDAQGKPKPAFEAFAAVRNEHVL
jgi:GH35 family endo-1,4-beta-xylanase